MYLPLFFSSYIYPLDFSLTTGCFVLNLSYTLWILIDSFPGVRLNSTFSQNALVLEFTFSIDAESPFFTRNL